MYNGLKNLLVNENTDFAKPIDKLYGKRSAAQLRQTMIKGIKIADKNKVASR